MSGAENFSGFEVMRAAIEIEKQGHLFYTALSRQAQTLQTQELFAQLADDEVQHLKTLADLLERFRDNAFWDNEEEYLPYLLRFHAETVFPTLDQVKAAGAEHAESRALELAIAAENNFAAYFRQAANHARDPEGREAFNWLADEEERHAEILERRLRALA